MQNGTAARDPTGEEVRGDLRFPGRFLDNRASVVRVHLGADPGDRRVAHSPPPMNESASPASIAVAAIAVVRHRRGRCLVGTIGSGGRPYTSGSSRSRKKAPNPPTPSSGSLP